MPLNVKDVMDIMEEYSPSKLKESYDNVGLLVGDKDEIVTNILVALDCTLKVIDEATALGCNLIITHHPVIFKKPESITTDTLIGSKIIKLIKNDINVFASHTNLDSTTEGITELILVSLGIDNFNVLDPIADNEAYGIGRLAVLDNSITLEELMKKIKSNLNIDILRYCGQEKAPIRKIALINGSGQDYISLALEKGADCIITGDTTYHYISDYSEMGIPIIDAGHYHTEWPAMKYVANIIQQRINYLSSGNKVYLSEENKNPYKYYQ